MAGDPIEVVGVSRKENLVLLSDGRIFPMTDFFDAFGNEVDCDDDGAVKAVCGALDCWFVVHFSDYEYVRPN